MTELKTKKNTKSVSAFLDQVKHPERKKDAKAMLNIMREITGKKPVMWGSSIVGFDSYHYRYPTGHEGDMCILGFSPRKEALVIYTMPGYQEFGPLLKKLGPHKIGKSCLYIRHLDQTNLPTLKKILKSAYHATKKRYAS